jgi:probable H4MPT-linked C1 transfer pathway protein
MTVNTISSPRQAATSDSAAPSLRQSAAGTVAGLDVGGVHVKGARAESGRLVDAFQIAAPTTAGLDTLAAALAEARDRLGAVGRYAVTITAELADVFPSRGAGVAALEVLIGRVLPADRTMVYGGRAGFLPLSDAAGHAGDVASANWHATASLVARLLPDALLADVGSTTADLIPVAGGRPVGRGYGDAERIAAGELLYTGATRSFVMAIAERVPFAGAWQPLMNEYFASMADVRRLTGELEDGVDQQATADGRGKSVAESRARLARMLGRDADDADEEAWRQVAHYLGERQLRSLHDAAAQVISHGRLAADAPVVGAGIGGFLTRALAERLGRRWLAFADLLPAEEPVRAWATRAAPAAAVALLAGLSG